MPGLDEAGRSHGPRAPRSQAGRARGPADGPSGHGGLLGRPSAGAPWRPAPPYWFQEYWAGAISPPLPVIHPPRARAKEAPLFVFQQLTPSAVDDQA